jgi:hypothetical protein
MGCGHKRVAKIQKSNSPWQSAGVQNESGCKEVGARASRKGLSNLDPKGGTLTAQQQRADLAAYMRRYRAIRKRLAGKRPRLLYARVNRPPVRTAYEQAELMPRALKILQDHLRFWREWSAEPIMESR